MNSLRQDADRLLYEFGLLEELKKYGEPHVIGSYVMDAMVARDLDIDVTNENMSMKKLYMLTSTLLERFAPSWFEAKQETTQDGKTVWFHGFETSIPGSLWNVDIWFFDSETGQKAVKFSKSVKCELDREPRKKTAVLQIKNGLIDRGAYSFDQYSSMDAYQAVLKKGILFSRGFLAVL